MIAGPRGTAQQASSLTATLFGYPDSQALVGRSIVGFLVPEDRVRARGLFSRRRTGYDPGLNEWRGLPAGSAKRHHVEHGGSARSGTPGRAGWIILAQRINEVYISLACISRSRLGMGYLG